MNIELFKELQNSNDEIRNEKLESVNFLINRLCENEVEFEILNHIIKMVKKDMIKELDKHNESFKFFSK